ncbi:hypothetical protein PUN28_007241 [Cardiocondyla obscurior]|uniref:Uncharacterized protein n=1 Tax=Cardiocondyla obscurior TaxID=286306 RepID=A0AAW2G2I3_9HYME
MSTLIASNHRLNRAARLRKPAASLKTVTLCSLNMIICFVHVADTSITYTYTYSFKFVRKALIPSPVHTFDDALINRVKPRYNITPRIPYDAEGLGVTRPRSHFREYRIVIARRNRGAGKVRRSMRTSRLRYPDVAKRLLLPEGTREGEARERRGRRVDTATSRTRGSLKGRRPAVFA